MSIGNLKDYGNKGNNFPWQLKMLQGLQAIYDEVKLPLTCVEDSITLCAPVGGLDVNIHDGAGNAITSTPIGPSQAIDVNIAGGVTLAVNLDPADDAVGIYGYTDITDPSTFTALSVDGNGHVNTNATIVGPISQQSITTSVSVALGTEQADVQITPVVLEYGNANGDLSGYPGTKVLSISFASRGTAFALVSTDGGTTYIRLYPGETLNLDANGVMNYYDPSLFYWDTIFNPTSQLLIAFNYI
jgi:hypothetical protein